ncbi:inosine-uridine preferring nucleoside hydrolase [Sodiomyces alkalinus F11]|uniref:Inosine-uridine preferring nucleoside hydrolase n=1 Tax=Sodiomyces alkalinus (strain CBS 110278 / VKM F-3762 / F11) TaxID=1314773 RepID=A0A3N2PQQ5_SODAK|nr:inosine-uridine preferring nucleoside hydrolase [Sodiomyces alkalinus F11]ROT36808.1 inosine-uridine preferring nucleoside hydrolase [Sodiomyces alkalinus F11]
MTITLPVPVWLDCDPGHDDTFAILMAAYHPAIKLLGISTLFGNAPVEKTTPNAASILTAISKHNDVPIYRGASHALVRPPMHAPTDIHGESGLDGTALLPQPLVPANTTKPAIDAMAAALSAQPPNTAWLVATGPLTNVAALFQKHPALVSHIKGLSLMGGVFGGGFTDIPLGRVDYKERIGNYTPWAEFNIIADPEAASFVFSHKQLSAKTTVVPLDLSHQVLATEEVRTLLLYGEEGQPDGPDGQNGPNGQDTQQQNGHPQPKSTLRQMLVELLMFFAKTYNDVFGISAGPPLHDPLALAVVLIGTTHEVAFHDFDTSKGGCIKYRERFAVTVDTEGTYEDAVAGRTQAGRTVAAKLPPASEGVRIPRRMDVAQFWRVLEECIQRADEANAAAGFGPESLPGLKNGTTRT